MVSQHRPVSWIGQVRGRLEGQARAESGTAPQVLAQWLRDTRVAAQQRLLGAHAHALHRVVEHAQEEIRVRADIVARQTLGGAGPHERVWVLEELRSPRIVVGQEVLKVRGLHAPPPGAALREHVDACRQSRVHHDAAQPVVRRVAEIYRDALHDP